MGSKIKGFLTNPLTAAVALLLTFNATQESIGKQFGAIGVTEFREDLAGANVQFTQLGLGASEAQSTISNLANEFGIKAIIQPGGSLRDQESIDMCNSKGISMVFTQKRHFLH